jgi:putative ABC transport system permease protein
VRDSGARTSISVGALITAVALFVSLVIMIHSFRQTVELWVNQTISGDLFVTTKMGGVNRFKYPIAERDVALLKDLAAGTDMVPSRRYQLRYSGFKYEFEALGMEPFLKRGGFVWLDGDPERLASEVINGDGVLISEVFANRTGLATGDLFSAGIDGSLVKLPVLGIVRDYRTDGGAVFYSWTAFKNRYHDPQWSGVRFYLPAGESGSAAAVEALRGRIAGQLGDRVDMITGFELRAVVLQIFDETFAVTIVLLIIALVVAALGIATTLTVLVLERSRQLNTLFAVGASFRQIRAMILWEAAFLVTAGEMAGLVCGFILSYVLIFVINRQSFGWTFLYGVDWASLAMSIPLIVLTALVAAIPAVRMVFREPPATLLRER